MQTGLWVSRRGYLDEVGSSRPTRGQHIPQAASWALLPDCGSCDQQPLVQAHCEGLYPHTAAPDDLSHPTSPLAFLSVL